MEQPCLINDAKNSKDLNIFSPLFTGSYKNAPFYLLAKIDTLLDKNKVASQGGMDTQLVTWF